jgi:hypothetical protein
MGKYLSTKVFEIYLPGVPKIKHGLNPNLPFHEPTPEIPLRYSRFIQGDGHCLFRAIAYWRFGDQDRHQEVRQAVIDFAPKHEEELKRGMTERGYDRWCQRIKGGGWGDQACLDLLARYYQLIIFTAGFHFRPAGLPRLPLSGWETIHFPEHLSKDNIFMRSEVYFLMFLGNHYEVLDPFDSFTLPRPPPL